MIEQQLQQYLDLGLTPIPLNGKKAVVKWKDWRPKTTDALKPYIRGNANWAVRTGGNLAVLDFDSEQAYVDFVSRNIDILTGDYPVVRTGRGYHLWFQPVRPLKSHAYDGVDLKAENSYVVCPPSIHSNGRRYIWQRPLGETIPTLNLDTLDLSGIGEKVRLPGNGHSAVQQSEDPWKLDDGFNSDDFDYGVREGRRHETLVQYLGVLVALNTPVADVFAKVNAWNLKNLPPLPQGELDATTISCLASFLGKPVSIKTLSRRVSVVSGTRTLAKPAAAPEDWNLDEGCTPSYRIVHVGHSFQSVAFFCGRWSCPRCGAYFKRQWISHIVEVTKGKDIHLIEIDESEWGRLRRSFSKERLDLDYARIANGGRFTVIVSGPHPEGKPLPAEKLVDLLKAVIPDKAEHRPVSVSRGWKKPLVEPEAKLVTTTLLPLPHQVEVAKQLGAKPGIVEDRWTSPADEDPEEWALKFTTALRVREIEVMLAMKKRPERVRDIWEGKWPLSEYYAEMGREMTSATA